MGKIGAGIFFGETINRETIETEIVPTRLSKKTENHASDYFPTGNDAGKPIAPFFSNALLMYLMQSFRFNSNEQ